MADCKICVKFDDCPWRSDPDAMCSAFKQKSQTNADRIRAMSDEELAKWLSCPGRKKDMFPNLELYIAPNCEEWLDWLKEEVKDG